MYNYISNGFIVYATSGTDYEPYNNFFKNNGNITYQGVHQYKDFPLSLDSKDKYIRTLAKEQFHQVEGDVWTSFINNKELLKRYIEACLIEGYTIRLIYIESEYALEQYTDDVPKSTFLGYEVCEIPLDACAIYDLFLCDFYEVFRQKLNQNGLFGNEKDAIDFMNQYKKDFTDGIVGDGEVALYVCKVYEVKYETLL